MIENEGKSLLPVEGSGENNQATEQPSHQTLAEETKQAATLPRKRHTQAGVFSPEEYQYLLSALKARQENKDKNGNPQPLTKDMNQLIRQCVDFALNSRKDAPKLVFALPDELPILYMKNGFFNNNNNK